jgi:hypothetical protein
MGILELNVFDIKINWDGNNKDSASISSNMKESVTEDNQLFNERIDAIESLILAHFCAGIDIDDPSYLEGIETTYLALANRIDN